MKDHDDSTFQEKLLQYSTGSARSVPQLESRALVNVALSISSIASTRESSEEKLGNAKAALCSAAASWHTNLRRAKKSSKSPKQKSFFLSWHLSSHSVTIKSWRFSIKLAHGGVSQRYAYDQRHAQTSCRKSSPFLCASFDKEETIRCNSYSI